MKLLDIFTFSGHLHPLIVHLPIGFILLATLFNLLSYTRRFGYLKQAVPITLLTGFIAAALACVFGYLLSLKGDYDADALSKHKLSGISLAAIAGVLYFSTTPFFLKEIPVPRPLFSLLLIGLVALMSYSGHQGASLTHGNNYLTMQVLLQKERVKPSGVEEALLFEDVIQPILQNKCVQCHRNGKSKGELSLETLEDMLRGGKSGPAIIPGKPDSSELIRRILLDEDHKDFMPADGKPPLTKNELHLIQWWVKEGNTISDSLKPYVAKYLGIETQEPGNIIQPTSLADTSLIANLRKTGLHVRLMQLQPLMLDITLPAGSGVKAALIKPAIQPLAKHIIWLNLSGNALTDDDLDFLPALINLEKLRLDKNPVTDKISERLIALKHLEAVNLNETNITKAAIDQLKKNTAIKRVYSWRTATE